MNKIRAMELGLLVWAAPTRSRPDLNAVAQRMAERLQLSEATAQALREAFARHADRYERGGFFWYVAAELQRRLNDEQRAEFWEEARRADRAHLKRRMRHARRTHREQMVRRMQRERLQRWDRRPLIHRTVWMATRRARLPDYLELTETQRDSLAVLRRRQGDALRELLRQRREGALSAEVFREQVRQLREQYRARFRRLLTPEQQQRLDWLGAIPENSRKAMLEVLRLTDTQQQQLAARALQPDPERRAPAEILTPEQQEIVRLHHQLVRAWQAVQRNE